MAQEPISDELLQALKCLQDNHFTDLLKITDILNRVVVMKEMLHGNDEDFDKVYSVTQKLIGDNLSCDADTFRGLYDKIAPLGKRDLLYILTVPNSKSGFTVSDVVFEKMAEHIGSDTHTVLVAECEKYGPALLDVIQAHPEIQFTLMYDKEYLTTKLCPTIYGDINNVHLVVGNIYGKDLPSDKFDLIITFPFLYGKSKPEDSDDDTFYCRDNNYIAVQNLIQRVNPDGRLAVILSNEIMFAGGGVAELRKYIEDNYGIAEIDVLPKEIFPSDMSLRINLFVFSGQKTESFILRRYNAGKPTKKTTETGYDVHKPKRDNLIYNALVPKDEKKITFDELMRLGDWNVDLLFEEEYATAKEFITSNVKKVRLDSVADVFRGKTINQQNKEGNIAVVNVSNITDTGIDYDSFIRIRDDERKLSRYKLEDGDILITIRGTTYKTGIFKNQNIICIPSANICAIRPKGTLKGEYLKIFFESPIGVNMLKCLQRGSKTINISCSDIGGLLVPLLTPEKQVEIINEYNAGLETYKATIKAAEKDWQAIKSNVWEKLF